MSEKLIDGWSKEQLARAHARRPGEFTAMLANGEIVPLMSADDARALAARYGTMDVLSSTPSARAYTEAAEGAENVRAAERYNGPSPSGEADADEALRARFPTMFTGGDQ